MWGGEDREGGREREGFNTILSAGSLRCIHTTVCMGWKMTTTYTIKNVQIQIHYILTVTIVKLTWKFLTKLRSKEDLIPSINILIWGIIFVVLECMYLNVCSPATRNHSATMFCLFTFSLCQKWKHVLCWLLLASAFYQIFESTVRFSVEIDLGFNSVTLITQIIYTRFYRGCGLI